MIKHSRIKGEKHIAPMNFAENQAFQRIAESFLTFMKGIVILVKIDKMLNILKLASQH